MNCTIPQSNGEPFSDEKLWGPKERTHKHYLIEKNLSEEKDSWDLLWVIRDRNRNDLPNALSGKFTSHTDAIIAIEAHIQATKENNSNV